MESEQQKAVLPLENNIPQTKVFEQGIQRLSRYRQISVIALCNQGDVRFCRTLDTNNPIVIKTIRKCLIRDEEEAAAICSQLNWLKLVNHPFILPIRDVFQDSRNLYVVSDFCSGGNLYYYQKVFDHLDDAHLRFIAVQLISAIHYLHEHGCLFCGVLAENVLIDQQGYIQLTGFSRMKTDITYPYYKMVGYMEYMSPEMLLNKGITQSYDWYLLGCLLYELAEGKIPFQGDTTTLILQHILLNKLEYKYASQGTQAFINALTNPDPNQRLGKDIQEMVTHEWMKEVPWDSICARSFPSPLARAVKNEDPTCYHPHFKEDILEVDDNENLFNEIFVSAITYLVVFSTTLGLS